MNYRILGRTGLRVSEVGFGAWASGGNRFGDSYGPTDDDASRAAIHAALDGGCTFFDTADVYGHGRSEELLGQLDEFPEGDIRDRWPARYRTTRIEAASYMKETLARPGRTLAQAALRFVLDEPAVSVVIPGAKTAAQVAENLAASDLPSLTAQERSAIPF